MRVPGVVAATGVAILAFLVALVAGSPPAYVHPDELSAVTFVDHIRGEAGVPPGLEPYRSFLQPHNVEPPRSGSGLWTAALEHSGIGPAHPLLLLPFVLLGPYGPYLPGLLSLVGAFVGLALLLDPRRAMSWALALLVCAIPPLLVQTTVIFSNAPGLALFLLALGCVAEATRGRSVLLVPAAAATIAAGAVRVEYLLGGAVLVPLTLVLLSVRPRGGPSRARTVAAFAAALVVGTALLAAVLASATGAWAIPYTHFRGSEPGFDLPGVVAGVLAENAGLDPYREAAIAEASAKNYVFGLVPFLAVGAALLALRPGRLPREAWLLMPLAAQSIAVWMFTASAPHYGARVAWLDASQPRYFLPLYAALAVACALFLRDALRPVSLRVPERAVALALVALVVLPGVAHATLGDHGLLWVAEQKSSHHTIDAEAARLPADAIVLGDYLSKVVHTRPVFVPARIGTNVPWTVMSLDENFSRATFVHLVWFVDDESFDYGGQIVAAAGTYVVPAGFGEWWEVRATRASVRGLFDLAPAEWNETGDRLLRAASERAHFRPAHPGSVLPLGDWAVANGTLAFTYEADGPVRVGYGSGAGARVLAEWNATVGQATRIVEIPNGTRLGGVLWVEGKPLVHRLDTAWETPRAPIVGPGDPYRMPGASR